MACLGQAYNLPKPTHSLNIIHCNWNIIFYLIFRHTTVIRAQNKPPDLHCQTKWFYLWNTHNKHLDFTFSGQLILEANYPEFVKRYSHKIRKQKNGRQNHQESHFMINTCYHETHPFLNICGMLDHDSSKSSVSLKVVKNVVGKIWDIF